MSVRYIHTARTTSQAHSGEIAPALTNDQPFLMPTATELKPEIPQTTSVDSADKVDAGMVAPVGAGHFNEGDGYDDLRERILEYHARPRSKRVPPAPRLNDPRRVMNVAKTVAYIADHDLTQVDTLQTSFAGIRKKLWSEPIEASRRRAGDVISQIFFDGLMRTGIYDWHNKE